MGLGADLKTYLQESTVHGLRYLVNTGEQMNGPWPMIVTERLAWSAVISVAFCIATILAAYSIQEANDNPILTTLATVPVQVRRHHALECAYN